MAAASAGTATAAVKRKAVADTTISRPVVSIRSVVGASPILAPPPASAPAAEAAAAANKRHKPEPASASAGTPDAAVSLVVTAAKTIAAAAAVRSSSRSPPPPPAPAACAAAPASTSIASADAGAPQVASATKPNKTNSKRAAIKVKPFVPFGGVKANGAAAAAAAAAADPVSDGPAAAEADTAATSIDAAAADQRERDRALQAARQAQLRAQTESEKNALKQKRRAARAAARGDSGAAIAIDLSSDSLDPSIAVPHLSSALNAILEANDTATATAAAAAASTTTVDAGTSAKAAEPSDASAAAPAAAAAALNDRERRAMEREAIELAERDRDRKERERREQNRQREKIGLEKDSFELAFDVPKLTALPPPPPPPPAPPARSPLLAAVTSRPLPVTPPRMALHRPSPASSPARRSPARFMVGATPSLSTTAAASMTTSVGVLSSAAAASVPYSASISAGTLPSGFTAVSASAAGGGSTFAGSDSSGDSSGYNFSYGRPHPSVVELISLPPHAFPPIPLLPPAPGAAASATAAAAGGGAAPKPVRIASFDMDDTLIQTATGKRFAQSAHDWKFFNSHVVSRVKSCHASGHLIVIFSNQLGISTGKTNEADLLSKIHTIAQVMQCPIRVLLSISDDSFRKPGTGMFDIVAKGKAVDRYNSFFVGDAAGRTAEERAAGASGGGGGGGDGDDEPVGLSSRRAVPRSGRKGASGFAGFYGGGPGGDFSGSDRRFAVLAGIAFYTPEQFFVPATETPVALYRPPIALPPANGTAAADAKSVAPTAGAAAAAATIDSKRSPAAVAASTTTTSTAAASASSSTAGAGGGGAPSSSSSPVSYTVPQQEVVMFIGCPASGKSTFYATHFQPSGRYVHVNRDTAGMHTVDQCLKRLRAALLAGSSVVIDNTHPSRASREPYMSCIREVQQLLSVHASRSARQSGSQSPPRSPSSASEIALAGSSAAGAAASPPRITVRAFVFVTAEAIARKLNIYRNRLNAQTALVPQSAYHNYRNAFQTPAAAEGFDEIRSVDTGKTLNFSERQNYIWEHSK